MRRQSARAAHAGASLGDGLSRSVTAPAEGVTRERSCPNVTCPCEGIGAVPARRVSPSGRHPEGDTRREKRDNDWSQVVALYDQLVRFDPSPITALDRAVAVAKLDGPEVALEIGRAHV